MLTLKYSFSHKHAGNDLVAVGHEHEGIELVGHGHGFNAVGNEFAAGEGILHAYVAHGDAVAHADGRHEDGSTARHADAVLHGLGDLVEVGVAGHDLAMGADHTDERAVEFFLGVTHGVEKTAVRGAFHALSDIGAAEFHIDSLVIKKGYSLIGGEC